MDEKFLTKLPPIIEERKEDQERTTKDPEPYPEHTTELDPGDLLVLASHNEQAPPAPVLQTCSRCKQAISAVKLVKYQGKTWHRSCLPFSPVVVPAAPPIIQKKKAFQDPSEEELEINPLAMPLPIIKEVEVGGMPEHISQPTSLTDNPRITLNISVRASELALLLELTAVALPQQPDLKLLHDRLANILCEHGNLYVRCAHCGKILKYHEHAKEIGGIFTKKVKEETGAVLSIPTEKFYSAVKSVEIFCSSACDLVYSQKLKKAWEQEQEEKKKKKAAKTGINNTLAQLMKAAKTNPELADNLAALVQNVLKQQAVEETEPEVRVTGEDK
jgi:hypothetical protein